jgi:NAD(P)-dependent dehydrogenase (short-subunit alcohol dehydrogenase family)
MVDQMMAAGQTEALNAMLKDVPIGRLGRAEEIADAVSLALQPLRKPGGRPLTRGGRWVYGTLKKTR